MVVRGRCVRVPGGLFDVRQPKRDLQSVIPPICLGAGRAVRKGDTELSVRQIALASLVALEGPIPEGMPVQECERVLRALPPGDLKIDLAALAVLAPAVPRPPRARTAIERVVQVITQQSAEGIAAPPAGVDSALADGELQLEVVQQKMGICGSRVPLSLEMDDDP